LLLILHILCTFIHFMFSTFWKRIICKKGRCITFHWIHWIICLSYIKKL
jgi:hypothetical protein